MAKTCNYHILEDDIRTATEIHGSWLRALSGLPWFRSGAEGSASGVLWIVGFTKGLERNIGSY